MFSSRRQNHTTPTAPIQTPTDPVPAPTEAHHRALGRRPRRALLPLPEPLRRIRGLDAVLVLSHLVVRRQQVHHREHRPLLQQLRRPGRLDAVCAVLVAEHGSRVPGRAPFYVQPRRELA